MNLMQAIDTSGRLGDYVRKPTYEERVANLEKRADGTYAEKEVLLVKQRKKRQLCDVELVAAGHSVWAHRCVLASCSKYVRHRPVAPCMLLTRLSTHQVL